MKIIAYFNNAGVPETGLTPTINAYTLDGTVVVNGENMVEIAGGFYYYDFTDYDEDEDYCFRADGGAGLPNANRYVISTNETAGIGNLIKVEKNRWKLEDNKLKIYDDDETTVLYQFNLKNQLGNPSMKDVFERVPI